MMIQTEVILQTITEMLAGTPIEVQIIMMLSAAARMHHLVPDLWFGQVWHESRYVPDACNVATGCKGLCQLNPRFFEEEGVDLFDIETNVYLGARYMADLLRRYDGNYTLALAAYNFGPANVDATLKTTPYAWVGVFPRETQLYVERILGSEHVAADQKEWRARAEETSLEE